MRKLTLNKESLSELSTAELDQVVGGNAVTNQTNCYCSDFAACLPTSRCVTLAYDCLTQSGGC
jgi:natural product precursor